MKPQHLLAVLCVVTITGGFTWSISEGISQATAVKVTRHVLDSNEKNRDAIKIAFLSDFHVTWNASSFKRVAEIVSMVESEEPDLILLGGDLTGEDYGSTNMIRSRIISSVEKLTDIAPTYTVLGNHEWWTNGPKWIDAITDSQIVLIEGKQLSLTVKNRLLCLRGLGDAYTDHYQPLPFSSDCTGLKVTLTHDPYAVELDDQLGIFLSGHTHCSQIKLPLIPPFWTPTKASQDLWCGWTLHNGRASFTSAGLGTSIIPIRIGTTSGFDVITIR